MRIQHISSLAILALLAAGCASVKENPQPLAVIPNVQTYEWAQKWWLPRHEEKLRTVANTDVDLLFIGDSITHYWENEGAIDVWNEFYANRKAANLGFSGDRTEQVIWRLQNGEVDGLSPKLVVLMIGTNNTGHRQDPAKETVLGIELIISELRERLPDSKILLLAVFPRGAAPDDELRRLNAEINSMLPLTADDRKVFFLDINPAFLDGNGVLSKEIMPDLLHPNANGYRIWAEAMEPTIRQLLGK